MISYITCQITSPLSQKINQRTTYDIYSTTDFSPFYSGYLNHDLPSRPLQIGQIKTSPFNMLPSFTGRTLLAMKIQYLPHNRILINKFVKVWKKVIYNWKNWVRHYWTYPFPKLMIRRGITVCWAEIILRGIIF